MKPVEARQKTIKREICLMLDEKQEALQDAEWEQWERAYYGMKDPFENTWEYDPKDYTIIRTIWEIKGKIITLGVEITKDEETLLEVLLKNTNLTIEEIAHMVLSLRE